MREIAGRDVKALRKPKLGQKCFRRLAQGGLLPRGAPKTEAVPGRGLHRKTYIVERREVAKDVRDLKGSGEAVAHAIGRRELGDVPPGKNYLAGIGLDVAGK